MIHINQKRILDLAKKVDLSTLTLQEIALQSGIGKASNQLIAFHIQKLKSRGYLASGASIEVKDISLVSLPYFGSANAGPATLLAENEPQGYVKISKSLMSEPAKNLFVMKVSGNSMNKESINNKPICDGNYVVVKKIQAPQEDDVIVTLVEGLVNIKKYKRIDQKTVALVSNSSENYPPIFLTSQDNPHIAGKVILVLGSININ